MLSSASTEVKPSSHFTDSNELDIKYDSSNEDGYHYRTSKLYERFRKEIEEGKFKATDKELNKLVLIPHFEPYDINYVPDVEPLAKAPTMTVKINEIEKNEPEKLNDIKSSSKIKSKQIYEKRMAKFYKAVQNDAQEHELSNAAELSMNRCLLEEKITTLMKHLIILRRQNEALNSHLLLLEKAKTQLTVQKQSLIESTLWQRREVRRMKNRAEIMCEQSQ